MNTDWVQVPEQVFQKMEVGKSFRFNDPLNDLFAAAGSSTNVVQLAPRREPPASYVQPTTYTEPCSKCRGSGNWRPGYPCFACEGTGRKTFATSPEQRHKAKVSAASRKEKNRQENIDSFKAAYPEVHAWMLANGSFSFAVSLLEAVAKYGDLTENQMAAAVRCIDRQRERDAAQAVAVAQAPTLDVSAIADALSRAKAKTGKRPKLYIGEYRFQFAPEYGQNAGAIYVTNKAKIYQGKIRAGRFQASHNAGSGIANELQEIARDPRAAAIAHGFKTGNCACCGRLLTDPVSVANGIGPICAEGFGW